MAYVAQVWLIPDSLIYPYLHRDEPLRGKYPKEDAVPYVTEERAKVAVGINPRTKPYLGDTADLALRAVMQAGLPGGRYLGEDQTKGDLHRRGVAYTLEPFGETPIFKNRGPLPALCKLPMLRGR